MTTATTDTGAIAPAVARNKARSARRRAREFALQGVYAWLLRSAPDAGDVGEIDAHLRESEDFQEADFDWYRTLFHGAIAQADALREHFSPQLDRPVAELSPVEHGILLVGTYELVYHLEVPYKVVINEAVELAKAFGGADGFKFVNGVLDRVAAELRAVEVQAAARRRR